MGNIVRTYLVGGAVRDRFLGRNSVDNDYVIVGVTPQEMTDLGFKAVGAAFPVFLHPKTGEEYALARRERKVGPGHTGFSVEFDPSVTLVEDLARRDLSINAMALDLETHELIDPYNGLADLKANVLRHVGSAFIEDPLRVVRLARFAARYAFTIAPDTRELAISVVDSGEMDSLSAERFWAEMVKVFDQGGYPLVFFETLANFGVLSKVKYFTDVFGTGNKTLLVTRISAVLSVLRHMPTLSPSERLMYVIVMAGFADAKLSAKSIPSDVQKLAANIRTLRKMPEANAENIYNLINANRGWGMQSVGIKDLANAINIGTDAGEDFVLRTAVLVCSALVGGDISAEGLLHLPGQEIGREMIRQRISAINEVIEELK